MMCNVGGGFYQVISWITLFMMFKCVYTEQYAGDSCKLRPRNTTGQCKSLADCPVAIDALRTRGISPQTCGFEGFRPIVCCVENTFSGKSPPNHEYKSKQKCKEYYEKYTKDVAVTPLHGLQKRCELFDDELIHRNKARAKEFPHMAVIGYEDEEKKILWLCDGALISEQFVLTAAHCLTNASHGEPKFIRIGDLILDIESEESIPQEFNVAKIFIHPEFQSPSFYNDIGLLKLDKSANFNSYVRPACLNTSSTLGDQRAIATFWANEDFTSNTNPRLLKETLKYFSHAECKTLYSNVSSEKISNGILDATQLCARLENQNTSLMETGVLQSYNKENYCMHTIVGIMSFGTTRGRANIPDIFTRVSAYIGWIEGIVWPS